MTKITTEELAGCPLFDNMSIGELSHIVNLLSIENYAADETIIEEGESHAIIWIVLKGSCQVFKRAKDGTQRDLAVIENLRTFGEMSFFHPAPHSATVRAMTDVTVARFDRARYFSLADLESRAALKIAFNTVGVLSERLRRMDDWICDDIESDGNRRGSQEWGEFRSKLYSEWQF